MRLSYKTEYALKTVLDLAQHADQEVVSTACIAKRQDIPPKFLEQILLALKSGGIVGSKRGARGGYFLRHSPAEITLADVIHVTEGTDEPAEQGQKFCPFREIWKAIDESVQQKLSAVTIQDMADRCVEQNGNSALEYVI